MKDEVIAFVESQNRYAHIRVVKAGRLPISW